MECVANTGSPGLWEASPFRIEPRKKVLAIHSGAMHSGFMIRKELVAASAEPLVLWLLERQGESYGYAIIQEIKARSEDRLQWTDGMLYPVLHRMEAKGL